MKQKMVKFVVLTRIEKESSDNESNLRHLQGLVGSSASGTMRWDEHPYGTIEVDFHLSKEQAQAIESQVNELPFVQGCMFYDPEILNSVEAEVKIPLGDPGEIQVQLPQTICEQTANITIQFLEGIYLASLHIGSDCVDKAEISPLHDMVVLGYRREYILSLDWIS